MSGLEAFCFEDKDGNVVVLGSVTLKSIDTYIISSCQMYCTIFRSLAGLVHYSPAEVTA